MTAPSTSAIHIAGYVAARSQDLGISDTILGRLSPDIDGSVNKKRKFFLRRRTTSYIKYKIPRLVLQQRGQGTVGVGRNVLKAIKPCRKQRRRICALVNEHRAMDPAADGQLTTRTMWLETHLWHRKRFFMRNLWGCMLPTRSFSRHGHGHARSKTLDKLMHSRAPTTAAMHCTVHDCSYVQPLELCGPLTRLEDMLGAMCDPATVQEIMASACAAHARELPLLLYQARAFPEGCLGPARAMWCPSSQLDRFSNACIEFKLWLWLHPSILQAAYQELAALATESASISMGVSVKSLSAEGVALSRYAVRGPGSLLVLARVVRAYSSLVEPNTGQHSFAPGATSGAFYEALLRRPASLPPVWPRGGTLCLDACNDGNLRSSSLGDETEDCAGDGVGSESQRTGTSSFRKPKSARLAWPAPHVSALFDPEARAALRVSYPSTEAVNSYRHARRVERFTLPGSGGGEPGKGGWGEKEPGRGSLGKLDSKPASDPFFACPSVPVMLVRQSASSSGVGSEEYFGFDLILPHIPGAAFWRLLQRAGASAVGLDEHWGLQKSAGLASFPRDYPETLAGEGFWQRERQEWTSKNDRRPRGKRVREAGVDMRLVLGSSGEVDDLKEKGDGKCAEPAAVCPFVVVRQKSYAQSLLQTLSRTDVEEKEGESGTLPFTTLVAVACIVSRHQRGYPVDGALIFLLRSTSDSCLRDGTQGDAEDATAEPAPKPIGCITSGDCMGRVEAAGGGGGRGTRFGLGLCLASGIAEMRKGHDMNVLYRNPNSRLLRPAVIELMFDQ